MKNMIRWEDPFAGISSLHSQLDDMFNNFFSLPAGAASRQHLAAMDVYNEGDERLVAEIQAPGFDRDEIEVNVHNGMLEIRGEQKAREEDEDKKRSYMVRESSASFYRRIALPKHADADNVEAHFDNGVLKVTIPFKELPKPKRIQIGAGKGKK